MKTQNETGAGETVLRISSFGTLSLHRLELQGEHAGTSNALARSADKAQGRGVALAQTLLKVLLCQPSRFASRDLLMETLWPDHPRGKAQARLDDASSALRTLLRSVSGSRANLLPAVHSSKESGNGYQLAPYPLIWVDADAFLWYVEQATRMERFADDPLPSWERAYALASRGTFLADEPYSEWAGERRELLAGQYRQCVHQLAHLHREHGGQARAEQVLRAYVVSHRDDEDALRPLMELLGAQERYQEALEQYEETKQALAFDGREPDTRTVDIAEYLRTKPIRRERSYRISSMLAGSSNLSPLAQTMTQAIIEAVRELGVQSNSTSSLVFPVPLTLEQQYMQAAPLREASPAGDGEGLSSVLQTVEQIVNIQNKASGISRRQALLILLGASGTALCVPATSSFLPAAEEIVAFCAANIAACQQLGKGNRQDVLAAHALVASYLPTLTALAQQPSPHQQSAADQAAIGYRLQAILSYHVENLAVADEHAKKAVFYSRIAEDANILVSSLVQRAMIAYYAHRREEAVAFCQEASLYLNQVTSRVRSYVYRVQAACLAQLGEEAEALTSLDLAYEHFYNPSLHEVSALHVAGEEFELFLWDGITRSHLVDQGQGSVAISLLKKADPLKNVALPERVRTGFLNNLVFAMLRMPAQQRDMEECVSIWTEAIKRACELRSELRYQEALRAYDEMLVAFPREQSILQLRRLIKTWDHQQ